MCKLTVNICQSETSPLIGWSEVCLPIDLPCFQLTLYTSNFFSESENYYPISRTPILGCLLLCIQPISSIRWERRKSLACFLSTFPYHLRCGKSKAGRMEERGCQPGGSRRFEILGDCVHGWTTSSLLRYSWQKLRLNRLPITFLCVGSGENASLS